MSRRRRALAACLFSTVALCTYLVVACADLVGIPTVEEAPAGGGDDGPASSEAGAVSVDAAGCGRALADGALRAGPDMVRIDSPLGSYCIDTTEVTVAQYNQYLFDGGSLIGVPSICYSDEAAAPPPADSDPSAQDLPVAHLGECQAWSYCLWAHKRLCGAIGDGGSVVGIARPQDTEWVYACVNGVQNLNYPYGSTYQPGTCVIDEEGGPAPVKSRPGCRGTTPPFDAIYDMAGNVWEFQNDLYGNGDGVTALGGAWTSPSTAVGCLEGNPFNGIRFYFLQSGFRCCADPEP
jgi:formylglycine-generating enzyme required for sulfatase activity